MSLLVSAVPLAVPLLLAALGETVTERSGVLNVGVEGMMLAGALAGFAGSFAAHSDVWGPAAGAAAAVVTGMTMASLFALLCVRGRADQVVTGTALNILSLGVTGVLLRAWFGGSGASAPALPGLPVPFLHRLPFLGETFFTQNIIGYAAWMLVPLVWWFLGRTRTGLRLRAAGEDPAAADGAGVSVSTMRTGATLFGGACAGLAGAFLSIGYTNGFAEGMTAGRGFIALAVVIVGRWNPFGAAAAALCFGLASAAQFGMQAEGGGATHIPYQVWQSLPYLLTLAALCLRRSRAAGAPGALGTAFQRG